MSIKSENEILSFVQATISRPLKLKELARDLKISPENYRAFRSDIKKLLAEGRLVNLKRGRIGIPEQMDLLVGTIAITKSGAGFLIREGVEQDLLIPANKLHTAFDGDKVMVRREGFEYGRPSGAVIKVIERVRRTMVGVFHRGPHFNFVEADDKRFHRAVYIPDMATLQARSGEKVVVQLEEWSDPHQNPEGAIVEVLGRPGERRVELRAIIRNFGLAQEFPREVVRQAEDAAKTFTAEEIERREDLRNERIYTIDPADAKDHDDAINVEKTTFGYRLGVHIADVSFFVTEGSVLDTEAYQRGNSVYLPGMVIPMLPETLSSDICSLRPDVDRLTQSMFIDFDHDGKPLTWRHADTVIRSCAKLSYEDAQAVLDGKEAPERALGLREDLLLAYELAQKLSKRRFAEGSLDFDLPEALVELDDTGEVVRLGVRVRLATHRLIEEFMLAANRSVALTVFRAGQKMLYRIHDRPDPEKLVEFSKLAEAFGHHFTISETISPKMVQKFLESIKDTPEEEYLNELALRSMKKAVYSPDNIGHFGLAFKHYTHFTSPIRRYPDLVVHRMLRHLINGHYPLAFARKVDATLGAVCVHCSETERVAEQAERESVKMMQAVYMSKHIGAEFNGIISGVIAPGFFVKLDHINAEGMVRVSSIDDDFYRYDPGRHRLVGSRTRRIFRLGDRVRVVLERVDIIRREVDLKWIPDIRGSAPDKSGKPKSKKQRALESVERVRGRVCGREKSDSSESTSRRFGRTKGKRKKR